MELIVFQKLTGTFWDSQNYGGQIRYTKMKVEELPFPVTFKI